MVRSPWVARIGNRESGIGNRESGIGNRESATRIRPYRAMGATFPSLRSLPELVSCVFLSVFRSGRRPRTSDLLLLVDSLPCNAGEG